MTSDKSGQQWNGAALRVVTGYCGPWRQYSQEGEMEVVQGEVIVRTNGKEQVFIKVGVKLGEGIWFDRENLVLDVMINHLQGLKRMEFRLLPDETNEKKYVSLLVPLLADAEASFLTESEWATLHLSLSNGTLVGIAPEECQARMWHLRVMLEDNAPDCVEVHLKDIRTVPRPQRGCISLHFDDGYRHHIQLVADLLRGYSTPEAELRATAFVMPRQLGLPNYLTPDDVQRLRDEYGWEIGAHHNDALTEMETGEFKQEMEYVMAFFQKRGWAIAPIHFAYPLGKMNQLRRQGVQQYFASARLIAGGPETLPPADWYRLRTINVTPLTPARELAHIAQWAIENGGWAIYMFHHIVEHPKALTEYAQTEFEIFLKFLREYKYGTTSMASVQQLKNF